MVKRSRRVGRRRRSRTNRVTTGINIRSVDTSSRIFQWATTTDTTTVFQLDSNLFDARDWRVSSYEVMLVADGPRICELDFLGAADRASTKDFLVSTVPVTIKWKTPRRSDFLLPPDSASLSIFTLGLSEGTSSKVTMSATARITFRPTHNAPSSLMSVDADQCCVVGKQL